MVKINVGPYKWYRCRLPGETRDIDERRRLAITPVTAASDYAAGLDFDDPPAAVEVFDDRAGAWLRYKVTGGTPPEAMLDIDAHDNGGES